MSKAIEPNIGAVSATTTSFASSSPDIDVAIIGAGPYGLAAGAHLKAKGFNSLIFGEPMEFWAEKMPAGMLLRSPRQASTISDPRSAYTLEAFEKAKGLAPAKPLPLETFVAYGRWFEQQLDGSVLRSMVSSVTTRPSGFSLKLQNGDTVTSRRVVVAAGVGPFRSKPRPFSDLPDSQCSHCYEGRKIAEFPGKRVAVIGAGQSALESGALLHEAGADVEVIARIPTLRWVGMHKWLHELGPLSRMMYSVYDVGPAGISRLVGWPNVMRHFPLSLKDKIRKRAVRSAGSRWLVPRVKPLKVSTGRSVVSVKSKGNEVILKLDDGTERCVHHVLLGTGYSVDINRYKFLSPELVNDVQHMDGYPVLEPGFITSVPGLHFVGATAARKFGPLLYFVAGTEFAAQNLASYIHRNRVKVGR